MEGEGGECSTVQGGREGCLDTSVMTADATAGLPDDAPTGLPATALRVPRREGRLGPGRRRCAVPRRVVGRRGGAPW
eukprot:1174435-Prymnesium_polylepis.1